MDEILNRSDDGSAEQENSGIEEENLPAEDSESVDEAEEQEELAQESEPEPEEETVFDSAQEEPAEADEEEVPEQESAQIDPDAIRYADAENSDLMPTNNAILEANELIEQTPSNIEQKNRNRCG